MEATRTLHGALCVNVPSPNSYPLTPPGLRHLGNVLTYLQPLPWAHAHCKGQNHVRTHAYGVATCYPIK